MPRIRSVRTGWQVLVIAEDYVPLEGTGQRAVGKWGEGLYKGMCVETGRYLRDMQTRDRYR